jgi:TonB family protein
MFSGWRTEALRIGLTGDVTLAFEIGIDGIAHDIGVVHSLGAGLDEQAVDCLRQWTFRPALDRKGNPVTAPATIKFSFLLPTSKEPTTPNPHLSTTGN